MAGDDPRNESRDNWEASSPAWERRRAEVARMGAVVAERMVRLLDPQPGETIVDVAAGVGDTGLLAAGALEPGGRLISTDLADGMVSAARRRAAELGVTNSEHVRADAAELPLADESVDGALCRWGYMLMPDAVAAMRETRRVLRPGGRLVLAVWTDPERNPWATLVGRVVVQRGLLPPPDPTQPNMFALGDHHRLRDALAEAGFEDVEAEDVELVATYASFDEYWETTTDLAHSLRTALGRVSEADRESIKAEVERNAEPFVSDDGMRVPGASVVAAARRPARR